MKTNVARLRVLLGRWMLTGLILVCALGGQSSATDTVQYSYDGAGRLRSVNTSCGATTTYSLDAAGNRTAVQSTSATSTNIVTFARAADTVSAGGTISLVADLSRCETTDAVTATYVLACTMHEGTDFHGHACKCDDVGA